MPIYAITGASKGIGLEFARQLASNPSNNVLAIVRNPESPSIATLASKHPNIHAIKGDVTDPQSILAAAQSAAAITDGKLDVLIHNSNAADAATVGYTPSQFPLDAEATRAAFEPSLLTAVYGGLWTTNAFLPLIEKGAEKKIVHISTGMADINLIKNGGVPIAVAYSVAKAGMNVQVAKYAAELAPKGIKVLALSPGWVDTSGGEKSEAEAQGDAYLLSRFQTVKPDLKGQIEPEESVRKSLKVIEELDAEKSGTFVSHNGNTEDWF
ncbi:NAD(P)-binding protein [Aspergillus karnatakaensis]|uniref:SDR family oxidoreductase n=1 Tax=Aspergillus karnatakaensis TaxID=1810916 RepID=UPI003CCDAFCD